MKREQETYLEVGTKTMMKVWWLTVPHVRSSSLCFWVFLKDEGTKMMMPVLSGN
jgi:lysozyme family protein